MTEFEAYARTRLPRWLRYAVMLTGESHQAADLVQDVTVKVFRQWSRIEGLDDPDNYVLRMITNGYLSWRRSWAVRYVVPVGEVLDSADVPGVGDTHADRDEMWARLAGLPRRQRAVLVLRYYEQLTDAEIAEVLGCSAVTVRGYAHRALTTLRAAIPSPSTLTQETK